MHELHVRVHGETPDDQLPKDKRGRPKRKRYVKTPPEFRAIALGSRPPSDGEVEAALRKMFALILEREPSAGDIAKFGAAISGSLDLVRQHLPEDLLLIVARLAPIERDHLLCELPGRDHRRRALC